MIIFLLIIIFWTVLLFFGWQLSRLIFRENKIEVLIPLSFIIGVSIYLFLLNLSSYFIPITINFYLVFAFLLILGIFLFYLNKHDAGKEVLVWGINKKEGILIFSVALVIMVFMGLISARTLGGDDLSQFHLTSAASIAGGNFPVRELNIPENYQVFHYAPNLLFAAIFKITHLPVWFASDLITFLFSGVIFLLLFLLARLIVKHNLKAFLIALVAILAGGLRFVYIIPGLITVFKRFVLHQDIAHPFSFFALVWDAGPVFTNSLPNLLLDSWAPLGWALFLAIIFIYLNYILKDNINKLYQAILVIVFLSVLALTIETGFVVISFVLIIYPFILYLYKKDKQQLKSLIIYSIFVLALTSVLVLVQGGTITVILRNILEDKVSMGEPMVFHFLKHPLAFLDNNQLFPFYSKDFLMNFGLVYLLIIPASIFILKRHPKEGVFLILISFLSFVIPFAISFNIFWQNTINRLFYSVNFVWASIVTIFLLWIEEHFRQKRIFRYFIFIVLFIICLDGFIFLLTRPLYAPHLTTVQENSFLAQLKKPNPVEAEAYNWIQKNTTIKDYFLTFDDISVTATNLPIAATYRFVFYSQRLAPVYTEGHNYIDNPYPKYPLSFEYRELIKDCKSTTLKELRYKYLVVNSNWPEGLEKKCLAHNNLELKFEISEGDKFIRIYKVL